MGEITIQIPEDVLHRLKQFKRVAWEDVVRETIVRTVEFLSLQEEWIKEWASRPLEEKEALLEEVERLLAKSKLTEKDVEELTRVVKKRA